jgi:ArsR family metal-binding transcriptional regulator
MSDERLIEDYELELCAPPCRPGAASWSARAALQTDIRALLPLLNARLKRADYDHGTGVLLWKEAGHKYAFRAREIRAAPAQDRDEARRLVDHAVALANEVWRLRGSIEPNFEKRTIPDLMKIYRLLPGSSCGDCGFSTCMAFAAALREGKTTLDCCPVLDQAAYAQERAGLEKMIGVCAL